MRTPPPVSTDPYPVKTLYEMRSNYLRAAFTFSPAYTDHVLTSAASGPDYVYSLLGNLEYDSRTGRGEQSLTYAPGVMLYQNTSARNSVSHRVAYELKYRVTEHVQVSLHDYFLRSSNVFNDSYFSPGQSVGGSGQYPSDLAIPPYADHQNLLGNGEIAYQYSARSMIGANGNFSKLDYLDLKQARGLCDSSSRGASGFFNHLLSKGQYVGVNYQYMDAVSCPTTMVSTTLTHTASFYYTKYFHSGVSVSAAAGPQHYNMAVAMFPASGSWEPFVSASAGWQRYRSTFAASYTRAVQGGGGLIGTFHTTRANGSFTRQMTPRWRIHAATDYQIHKTVNSLFGSGQNGHGIGGTVAVTRILGEHLRAEFGYQRVHQRYASVPALSTTPDINRAYMSLTFDFSRPLGR